MQNAYECPNTRWSTMLWSTQPTKVYLNQHILNRSKPSLVIGRRCNVIAKPVAVVYVSSIVDRTKISSKHVLNYELEFTV